VIAPNLLVKDARKSAGLSQYELARRLGTTQSAIARLEARGANPRLQTLIRAVEATGNTLDAQVSPRARGIDETLISGGLHESPAERLHHFENLYKTARDLSGRAFKRDRP
jgi:transcriptional regulator with XRE-family HTH domain